jgi:hypothetical protein
MKKEPCLVDDVRDVFSAILQDPLLAAPSALAVAASLALAAGLAIWWR